MRWTAFFLCALPALAAASAPLPPSDRSIDAALAQARAEAKAAEREERRLEAIAAQARSEAERLGARQAAAAQAIASAEARISAADAEARLLAARLSLQRRFLAEQQAPATALLAGLAMMSQRPPLLAIADGGSLDELVRVRLLLDSTLPVIRRRTAALAADLDRSRRLERALVASRRAMSSRRDELAGRLREFAALEEQASRIAERSGSEALGLGDAALAGGEEVERLESEAARAAAGRRLAAELAALGEAPARPFAAEGVAPAASLDYRLPVAAPVVEGFGAVGRTGIRSRGLTLGTRRGQPLDAPAAGVIRFAGPYRSHDAVIIIDHGRGWMSLLLNASSAHKPGARVQAGQPLGHALGAIGVELSQNGRHVSPALIAGSSRTLSKSGKSG